MFGYFHVLYGIYVQRHDANGMHVFWDSNGKNLEKTGMRNQTRSIFYILPFFACVAIHELSVTTTILYLFNILILISIFFFFLFPCAPLHSIHLLLFLIPDLLA